MPKLMILIGLPASGKDEWSKRYIEANPNTIMLSSDAIRAELYGDETVQDEPHKVFALMQKRTLENLRAGKDVIYNATNITYKNRHSILAQVKHNLNVFIEAIVFAVPFEVCKLRNSQRERQVPDYVYHRMLCRWQTPFAGEGFDEIRIVNFEKTSEFAVQYLSDIWKFGDQKNPHHSLSLGEHCYQCADKLDAFGMFNEGMWHDAGKVYTQTFDENGIAHYYAHENYSAYLYLSTTNDIHGAQVINYHMLPYNDNDKNVWKKRLGEELWRDIMRLHKADEEAH